MKWKKKSKEIVYKPVGFSVLSLFRGSLLKIQTLTVWIRNFWIKNHFFFFFVFFLSLGPLTNYPEEARCYIPVRIAFFFKPYHKQSNGWYETSNPNTKIYYLVTMLQMLKGKVNKKKTKIIETTCTHTKTQSSHDRNQKSIWYRKLFSYIGKTLYMSLYPRTVTSSSSSSFSF